MDSELPHSRTRSRARAAFDARVREPDLRAGRLRLLARLRRGPAAQRQRHAGRGRHLGAESTRGSARSTSYQNLGYITYKALQTRVEYRGDDAARRRVVHPAARRRRTAGHRRRRRPATNPLDINVDDGPDQRGPAARRGLRLLVPLPVGLPAGGHRAVLQPAALQRDQRATWCTRARCRATRCAATTSRTWTCASARTSSFARADGRVDLLGDVQRVQHDELHPVPGQPARRRRSDCRSARCRCGGSRSGFRFDF